MRRLLLVTVMCLAGPALLSAPAAAATPSLKAAFAPLNAQIVKTGIDIATSINGAGNATDAQIAKQFQGLAIRTTAQSIKVGKLKGATGATLTIQRNVQLALAKGASDLASIYAAAVLHSESKAKAATIKLLKDAAPIKSFRIAFVKAVGLKP